jgi:hypothetical protein
MTYSLDMFLHVFSECGAIYSGDYSLPRYSANTRKGCNLHTRCTENMKSQNIKVLDSLHILLTRICEHSATFGLGKKQGDQSHYIRNYQ